MDLPHPGGPAMPTGLTISSPPSRCKMWKARPRFYVAGPEPFPPDTAASMPRW
jgi:hypothetical protein